MAIRLAEQTANAEADMIGHMLTGGSLYIYAGQRPANADRAINGQRMLAHLRFTTFARAEGGVCLAHEMEPELAAPVSGTARWFRATNAADAPVLDGAVGDELVLDNVEIAQGARVALGEFAYKVTMR